MTNQGNGPDAAPAIDTSLALEMCLYRCEDEYDWERLSLHPDEQELCEQLCHDTYDRDDDDWSDDDDE